MVPALFEEIRIVLVSGMISAESVGKDDQRNRPFRFRQGQDSVQFSHAAADPDFLRRVSFRRAEPG